MSRWQLEAIPPGATLGVFGSGQLARMFTMAAQRMGYRVAVYSPERGSPAALAGAQETVAPYDDLKAVRRFGGEVAAATIEFENVPAATILAAAEVTVVRPGASVLGVAQNRRREREFLAGHGFPATTWAPVDTAASLDAALARVGTPAVLKTSGFGYDGKGQARIATRGDGPVSLAAIGGPPAVAETFVTFEREVSVIVGRAADGAMTDFGVIENRHVNHILDLSLAPGAIPDQAARRARELARDIAVALDIAGLLCVEMFVLSGGDLLVNELAPRPHNSGHLTIEACATSQFEQQVPITAGLPLGSTAYHRPAAMAQLLGDLWNSREPDWATALAIPGVSLHLYEKAHPRPGRKMGHLTALADTADQAAALVLRAREALNRRV